MKKKFSRSLVFVFLVVFMCTFLTGCTTTYTNVTDIEVTFDDRSITVSSPKNNTFKLALEIEANSVTTSWASKNLSVSKEASHTYKLENLVGDYVSDNARITSVDVMSATVTDHFTDSALIFLLGFVIGAIGVYWASSR